MNKIDDEIMDLIGQLTDFELDEIDKPDIKSEKDNYSSSKNEYLPVVKKKDSKTEEPEEDDYYSTMTDDEKESLSKIDKIIEESKSKEKDINKNNDYKISEPLFKYIDFRSLVNSYGLDEKFIDKSDYIPELKNSFKLMLNKRANLSLKYILLLQENTKSLIKNANNSTEERPIDSSYFDNNVNEVPIGYKYIAIDEQKDCFVIYTKKRNEKKQRDELKKTGELILLNRYNIIRMYAYQESYKQYKRLLYNGIKITKIEYENLFYKIFIEQYNKEVTVEWKP